MIKKVIIYLFLVGVTLNTLLWIISPWVVAPLINQFLEKQNLHLSSESSIEINPFGLKLALKDISLKHEQDELLSLTYAAIDLNPLQLINKQIRIESIVFNGFSTKVQFEQDGIIIGNTPLDKLLPKSDSATAADVKPTTQETDTAPFDWQIYADEIDISSFSAAVIQSSQTTHLTLDKFKIRELNFKDNVISLTQNLKLSPKFADAEHELEANVQLQVSSNVILDLNKEQLKLTSANVELAKLKVNQPTISANLEQLLIDLPELQLANWSTGLSAELALQINLDNLSLVDTSADKTIFQISNMAFNQLSVNGNLETAEIGLSSFELAQLNLFATHPEQPDLLSLDTLKINSLAANKSSAIIEQISIGSFKSHPVVSENKRLANWTLPVTNSDSDGENQSIKADASNVAAEKKPHEAGRSDNTPLFPITINQINNEQDWVLAFTDLSVKPEVNVSAAIKQFEVKNFSTQSSKESTQIEVAGTIQEYGKFRLNSQHSPFSSPALHDIKFDLTELELPVFSPYVDQALGYDIDSGQLDTNVEVNIRDNLLNGESMTTLKSVELTDIETSGEQDNIDTGAISFNMALGMLKDSDGIVELDIPIEGDLNNPSVGMSGILSLVIKKATMMAAKDYLMTTFVPYSQVVSIALTAGETLLKMDFSDMPFSAGQSALNTDNGIYLDQLSEVLKKQPDLRLRMCAISTLRDIELNSTKKALTQTQTDDLLSLAKLRAENSKRWLVKEKKIASNRLLLCSATLKLDQEKPGALLIEQI